MKLLSKTAEDRYQTAAGAEWDLRRCLSEWEAVGRVAEFPLGTQDTTRQLLIPEKLYGRDRAIATLLQAFDRVVAKATPELVLVAGYSGIGKSSVVNELHKVIVLPRGIFISGKFDLRLRDIPYSTLAQAFRTLVRQILNGAEADIARWRDATREAVGKQGRLLTDLIPELTTLIGPQPPVPVLSPFENAGALPVHLPQLRRRLRASRASIGDLRRRPAMAGSGDADRRRVSRDPYGYAAPAAHRRLPR